MKNNRGFTFIELLMVMSLIAIISLIIFPSISGMLKEMNKNKKEAFKSDIFLATEAYIQKNIDSDESLANLKEIGGTVTIDIEKLYYPKKYIKSTLVNPYYCDSDGICTSKRVCVPNESGGCTFDDYKIVVTTDIDGTYKYELKEP